jgi:hypothetical protein
MSRTLQVYILIEGQWQRGALVLSRVLCWCVDPRDHARTLVFVAGGDPVTVSDSGDRFERRWRAVVNFLAIPPGDAQPELPETQ